MKTSESIKQIIPALLKVQNEVISFNKDGFNPHFKNNYITLDSILADVRPKLTEENLLLIQEVHSDGEYAEITTTIYHESGEYIQAETLKLKPTQNNPQQMGSAITYGKRYQLSSLLGVSSETDDDGAGASKGADKKKRAPEGPSATGVLSEAQIKRFYAIARSGGYTPAQANKALQATYNIDDPTKLTRAQYDEVCNAMESKKKSKAPTSAEVDAAIDEGVPF